MIDCSTSSQPGTGDVFSYNAQRQHTSLSAFKGAGLSGKHTNPLLWEPRYMLSLVMTKFSG